MSQNSGEDKKRLKEDKGLLRRELSGITEVDQAFIIEGLKRLRNMMEGQGPRQTPNNKPGGSEPSM